MQYEKTDDMRVRFFSSQPGKCANVESACTRRLLRKKCLHFSELFEKVDGQLQRPLRVARLHEPMLRPREQDELRPLFLRELLGDDR